jgi:GINS complex subunit 3
VSIPGIYQSTYGEICRADATAIDLGKLNKYFYELGRYVAAFDRNGFVGKMIYEVIGFTDFPAVLLST